MSLKEYLKGSVDEMRKATWPSKEEVVRVTIAVLVFTAVFALILFGIDYTARVLLQGILR